MKDQNDLTSILMRPKSETDAKIPDTWENLSKEKKAEFINKVNQISQESRIDILSDQPVAKDAFGFQTLVRTLADIVLSESTETPITIGIDGEWGTGKTSILKMIETEAHRSGLPCIWLNAWSLESTDSMFLSVAKQILDEFKSRGQQSDERNFKNSIIDWLLETTITIGNTFSGFNLLDRSNLEKLLGYERYVSGVREVTKAARTRDENLAELASVATTHRSFEQLIETLFKNSKYEESRLIVLIDDLDRALPDQIATILKNLKLILEVPRCVFILAMDMNVVARSIAKHYEQRNISSSTINLDGITENSRIEVKPMDQQKTVGEDFGYHYLEKLVQIRIEVPPLTRKDVDGYLKNIGIAPEIQEIVKWAPDEEILNPRRLKRYLNWLSVSLQLITSTPMPGDIRNVTAIRAMALRHDYPEVYTSLINLSSKDRDNSEMRRYYALVRPKASSKCLKYLKERQFFAFSDAELQEVSNALGIDRKNLDNETTNLLYSVIYLIMSRKLVSEMTTTQMESTILSFCKVNYPVKSEERFIDLANMLVKSQLVKEETREFLQYLAQLPRHELLKFDKLMREMPILDVSSRENWISQEEKRDSYIAQMIRDIAESPPQSDTAK